VLRQDYRPLQLLVVDDGSTDATAQIVMAFAEPEVTYLYQPNQGHGPAKNTGLAHASGDYIAFLDADDVWLPRKLRSQVERMEPDPDLALTVCLMRNVVEPTVAEGLSGSQLDRMAGEQPAWLPSALVARRSTFDLVGTFDETFVRGNDTDWFGRVRAHGLKWAVVEEVLLERRIHGGNQSLHVDATHQELLRAMRAKVARSRRAAGPD
jgi:glycosyltransferase involved in cell wall biosynthesis